MEGSDSQGDIPKLYVTENTYIVDPAGQGEGYVVRQDIVQKVILEVLEERLAGQTYDPVKGAQRAKQLADNIKERVKALGYSRHKLVVQVLHGQKKGQAVRVVSRCLWDAHSDTAASATFESETIYCVCQVYALYME